MPLPERNPHLFVSRFLTTDYIASNKGSTEIETCDLVPRGFVSLLNRQEPIIQGLLWQFTCRAVNNRCKCQLESKPLRPNFPRLFGYFSSD